MKEVIEGSAKRWDQLVRYRVIEIIAQWEGRLTTNHLCDRFSIGRQQASKDINTYSGDIAPGNLEYDSSLKGYRPSKTFKPVISSGLIDEYLHVLDREHDAGHPFQMLGGGVISSEFLKAPLRSIDVEVMRPLVKSIREGRRLEINYTSMGTPEGEYRIIVPHTLVCTSLRWHVRAYCERNRDYRDFVLSRLFGEPELMGRSDQSAEQDEKWNTWVDMVLQPDERLTAAQKKFVAHEYAMKNGQLTVRTRGALVHYMMQALNITLDRESNPAAQQIEVVNKDEIKDYLFG